MPASIQPRPARRVAIARFNLLKRFSTLKRFALLSCICLAAAACASAPYTGRSQFIIMSESEEMRQGLEYSRQIIAQEKVEEGTARARRVEKIGQAIATAAEKPQYDWLFKVIDSDEVNAFCLPGGKVFVYTGILDLVGDNDDELAAIIGHEVAHALARHGAERSSQNNMASLGVTLGSVAAGIATNSNSVAGVSRTGGSLAARLGLLLPYSRLHESEADHIGVILAAKAGYDPRAAISLWEKMAALNEGKEPSAMLSTHPLNSQRIENLEKLMPEVLKYYHPRS